MKPSPRMACFLPCRAARVYVPGVTARRQGRTAGTQFFRRGLARLESCGVKSRHVARVDSRDRRELACDQELMFVFSSSLMCVATCVAHCMRQCSEFPITADSPFTRSLASDGGDQAALVLTPRRVGALPTLAGKCSCLATGDGEDTEDPSDDDHEIAPEEQ